MATTTPAAKQAATTPAAKAAAPVRHCECGCGAVVTRRFLQGHDARLKGRLQRDVRAATTAAAKRAAVARLVALGWSRFVPADAPAAKPATPAAATPAAKAPRSKRPAA